MTATAVFGVRWIAALVMVLCGGAATALIASRLRKQKSNALSADQG
jgi:hypothetical protein